MSNLADPEFSCYSEINESGCHHELCSSSDPCVVVGFLSVSQIEQA